MIFHSYPRKNVDSCWRSALIKARNHYAAGSIEYAQDTIQKYNPKSGTNDILKELASCFLTLDSEVNKTVRESAIEKN